MRKLVSSASALAADRVAEVDFGYPPLLLMEEAAIRLQDRLVSLVGSHWMAPGAGPVVYLAGPGNNGGDALAMARHGFLAGLPVAVVRVGGPRTPSCVVQDAWVRKLGIPAWDYPSDRALAVLGAASVWVDGLWGAGLTSALRPDQAGWVADLGRRVGPGAPVAAIDVPSGLWEGWTPDQPVLGARWTLVPGPAKEFCYFPESRPLVGEIVPVPLGYPVAPAGSTDLIEAADLTPLVPGVDAFAHKGRRGHVAVVGGAPGMPGALVLAARSAAAAGAGLVSVGTDDDLVALVAPQVPAFQVRSAADVLARAERYDAWVAGPGWGDGLDRVTLFEALWATDLPLVVDADALGAWALLAPPPRLAPTVFTPHPGEFRRLAPGTGPLVPRASVLARESGAVVVLKGAVTWVVAPDGRRSVWDGPNPALGTGGSGDCLAGVVGALLAAGQGAFDAARAGVALHGVAGRTLATEGWFTADRLPDALAQVSLACRTGNLRV